MTNNQDLFFKAIEYGDIESINLMLARGYGHPNRPKVGGWNPLQYAIARSALPIIKALLDNGADPNMQLPFSSLFGAVVYDRGPDIFRALFIAGADPNIPDFDGNTTIHQAFQWQRPRRTIKFIADNGGNVDLHDSNGKTILMNAILRNENSSYIRWLINDLGVDCTVRAIGSNTTAPHFYAQCNENLVLFNLSPPMLSTTFDQSILATLIRAGADINAIDSMGTTPLYHAVREGKDQLVKALLHITADPNLSDHNNRFPVHVAIARQRVDLIAMLVAAGADVNAPDANGNSPLHLAARMGPEGYLAADFLIQLHCNLEATNDHGRTPLHEAAIKGDYHHMFALKRAGANVDSQDTNGMTPLHHAVLPPKSLVPALKFASTSMPDMSIKDRFGRTALYYMLLRKPSVDQVRTFIQQSPTQFNVN